MTMPTWPRSYLLMVLAPLLVGAEPIGTEAPTKPITRWTEIEAATGMMNFDGTLRLNLLLGGSDVLEQLGIRCELRHSIGVDAQGKARTVWRILGLQSSLVPTGRDQLRWRPPAAESVDFDRAKIGRALSGAGSTRWLIREMAFGGEYEIRSADGRVWRYRQGVLVGLEHPSLGRFSLVTQGAWVCEVRLREDSTGGIPLLSACYDEAGRVRSCIFGSEQPHRFEWDASGQLLSWQRADGVVVHFTYSEGLLAGLTESGKPPHRFAWANNPGHQRGDSRWAAPVHLAADGENTYDYGLTSKGFVLHRRESSTEFETRTVFNPRLRRMEQRQKGGTIRAIFRGDRASAVMLERIETGAGEILEAYRYDQQGKLVGVTRKGEPERMLTYDDSGRLMNLTEIPKP